MAQDLEVTSRTLYEWARKAREEDYPPLGRRKTPGVQAFRAIMLIGREARHQEYPGWRPVHAALKERAPYRLIQRYATLFKERHRSRHMRRLAQNRITVEVLGRDVIWGQDNTHIGRLQSGKEIKTEVIRDQGTTKRVKIFTGVPTTGEQVMNLLEQSKKERGGLPLVYQTDNGSNYVDARVENYLKREKVVHLRSLPHTPQHNAGTECDIGELKRSTGLGKGVVLGDVKRAHDLLCGTAERLDKNRLRLSRGLKTARELDEEMVVGDAVVDRERFYEHCNERIKLAVHDTQSMRAGRRAKRNAIYAVLEEFGLVRRYRGGQLLMPSELKV